MHETSEAAVIDRDTPSRRYGVIHYVPLFVPLLILFVVLRVTGLDFSKNLFVLGRYGLNIAHVLELIVLVIFVWELTKVSEPRVKDTGAVLGMFAAFGLYFAIFIIAANDAHFLWVFSPAMFSNTDFLMLMIASGIEAVGAQIINIRSVQRDIVSTH